jgi:phosphatidylglycerol:prolipoprotein diacylglycerol transferase
MSWYGLIVGIAVVVAISLFEKNNKIISKNLLNRFYAGLLVSMLLGARIYHVIDYWWYYSKNLPQIFYTWNGGLGIFGAIFGGILFIFWFSRKNKLDFIKLGNQIALVLPLAQAIGRVGNFVNKENPWWWLEAILDLVLFGLINKFPKNAAGKYLFGYGLIRMVTEIFRQDTWTIGEVKIGMIISMIFLILGIKLVSEKR